VLALRRDEAALRLGDFEVLHADDALLVFARNHRNDRIVCAFNLSAEPQVWADAADLTPLLSIGVTGADLAPYGALIARKD
jgi:alpha-glucosidase